MAENMEQQNVGENEETPEVEAHTANVLDLQAIKIQGGASDGGICVSLISYIHGAETTTA
ncbi:hypothetical protein [Kitasatospora sp. NPDC093102]|uniref:hypothetical protein n=1 Tax=Kitasatospora sp. NPDC093102 TaxID=3155069 RepID=UPI00342D3061